MRRICFVADSFFADPSTVITGPQVQIYRIGQELLRRGWQVSIVAYRDNPGTRRETYKGLDIHWVPKRRFAPLLGIISVVHTLFMVRADCYYQRGRDVLTGMTALYCRYAHKTFIWASAGETGTDPGKYINQAKKKKRAGLLKSLLLMEAWINDRCVEYGIRNASNIVVQTEYQQTRLRRHFNRVAAIIPSGHVPVERSNRSREFTVLWIGSLKPIKRPHLFLELAELCDGLPCRFLMAGPIVDPTFGNDFQKLLNRSQRVKYVGAIPFHQSDELIASAHILVNTTQAGYEGIPNAFVQAWLSGTLTISLAADPDGIIQGHKLGTVAKELKSLAQFIEKMSSSGTLWEKQSEQTMRFARDRFTIESVTDRLEPLLLNEPPNAG